VKKYQDAIRNLTASVKISDVYDPELLK